MINECKKEKESPILNVNEDYKGEDLGQDREPVLGQVVDHDGDVMDLDHNCDGFNPRKKQIKKTDRLIKENLQRNDDNDNCDDLDPGQDKVQDDEQGQVYAKVKELDQGLDENGEESQEEKDREILTFLHEKMTENERDDLKRLDLCTESAVRSAVWQLIVARKIKDHELWSN